MKVILTKDVAKVGRKNEVKELADGFARNFIMARGLGVMADAKNLTKLKAEGVKKEVQGDLLNKLLLALSDKVIKLTAKANEQGHLFASIHLADILQALKQQYRLEIPETMVIFPEPLKAIGDYRVALVNTDTTLTVRVLPS